MSISRCTPSASRQVWGGVGYGDLVWVGMDRKPRVRLRGKTLLTQAHLPIIGEQRSFMLASSTATISIAGIVTLHVTQLAMPSPACRSHVTCHSTCWTSRDTTGRCILRHCFGSMICGVMGRCILRHCFGSMICGVMGRCSLRHCFGSMICGVMGRWSLRHFSAHRTAALCAASS